MGLFDRWRPRDVLDPPGPQRAYLRNLLGHGATIVVVVLAVVLAAQAIVRVNFPRTPLWFPGFWRLTLMSPGESLAFCLAVLALLATRQQIALGTRPFLRYDGQQANTSEAGLPGDAPADGYWRCSLKNAGTGVAYLDSTAYRVNVDIPNDREYKSYTAVTRELKALGYTQGQHYVLTSFGDGVAIAPNESLRLLELPRLVAEKLRQVDIRLRFRGPLGDRYEKEIHCIPRRGIHPRGAAS